MNSIGSFRLANPKDKKSIVQKVKNKSLIGFFELFSDLHPEEFIFEYDGTIWIVEDRYCVNPECECRQSFLVFLKYTKEPKPVEEAFAVMLSLENGTYLVEKENSDLAYPGLDAIVACFVGQIGTFFGILKTRYAKMKSQGKKLYAQIERESEQAIAVQAHTLPVESVPDFNMPVTISPGRNDPCPCGSGKKYKKCCGK